MLSWKVGSQKTKVAKHRMAAAVNSLVKDTEECYCVTLRQSLVSSAWHLAGTGKVPGGKASVGAGADGEEAGCSKPLSDTLTVTPLHQSTASVTVTGATNNQIIEKWLDQDLPMPVVQPNQISPAIPNGNKLGLSWSSTASQIAP